MKADPVTVSSTTPTPIRTIRLLSEFMTLLTSTPAAVHASVNNRLPHFKSIASFNT
jgi:hypothetical protein